MTRQYEEVQPKENLVKMYCCGPTVYGDAHIGNLRSYVFEDVLHKTIKKAGFDLKHVMNITDVGHLTNDDVDTGEDKMVKAAKEAKKSVLDIAKIYEDKFFADCAKLRIARPDVVTRATEFVDKMIPFAQVLQEKGFAYFAGGNLYFDTSKCPNYGSLSGQKLEDRSHGERVDVDPNKRTATDFVLWFTESKFEDHALNWESPWGEGYPGWHLECSVMSIDALGEEIDIHCGGVDNIFPHHENEIAQSEAYLGHKWVKSWVHGEHLNLKEGKMSKSKGHKFTISALEEQGYKAEHYRYLCLTAHYRTQLIFSYENLDNARNTYNNLVKKIKELKKDANERDSIEKIYTKEELKEFAEGAKFYTDKFNDYLFDDLNTPRALATMWEFLKYRRSGKYSLEFIKQADKVFSLGLTEIIDAEDEAVTIPAEVQILVQDRTTARELRDFAKSDEIRDKLASMGWVVKDTAGGQEITKA